MAETDRIEVVLARGGNLASGVSGARLRTSYTHLPVNRTNLLIGGEIQSDGRRDAANFTHFPVRLFTLFRLLRMIK